MQRIALSELTTEHGQTLASSMHAVSGSIEGHLVDMDASAGEVGQRAQHRHLADGPIKNALFAPPPATGLTLLLVFTNESSPLQECADRHSTYRLFRGPQ